MDEEDKLRAIFERYEKLLFKAANDVKSETPYSYVREFSKRVDAATVDFKQRAKRFVDKAIPDIDLSAAAEEILRKKGAYNETANVKLTTYVQMVAKLNTAAEQFKDKIQAHIDEDKKNDVTTTVSDLREYIKDELDSGHSLTVRYSNGAEMPTDKYAAMLARTTRMETQNIAMVGKAIDDGNDLVECSVIHPTCPTCARLQGRIYSISGNTPGYPSLYDTAFKNGYSIIHPNCRHQFFPYNPKFHTEEENERLQRDTNRPWDEETSDINAKEAEKYREQYAKAQMQMRKWNKELNEYAEMRERFGKDAPYKTLGAFRRAYRSEEGSLSYAKTHYFRRDSKQFEEFKKVLGAENMPETVEKFQELKYNKSKEFEELRQTKIQEQDYLTATSGGKHHGKLVDFEKNQNNKQLEKSIRKYNKTIEEHQQKMADPRSFYPDWDKFDERQKAGYLRKWEKDLKRNTEERNVAIGLLKRRKKDENK